MSLLDNPFDPAREAALVTGAEMASAVPLPKPWSAKVYEPCSPT